jgi:hypothetical protein
MQYDNVEKHYQALLNLYNLEIDTLKENLLNGEPWDNLKVLRRNITELAMALHKSYGHKFSQNVDWGNPAEFPQPDKTFEQPVE